MGDHPDRPLRRVDSGVLLLELAQLPQHDEYRPFRRLFLQSDPYDPHGDYFARSPVVHARNCRTPTLLMHGELDLCTPPGQAQEMHRALADAGCRRSFVVYPREGHGWAERGHLEDAWVRVLGWFDRHLATEAQEPAGVVASARAE